jgi:hypothetical protein
LRREGAYSVSKSQPWSPPLEDRVLLVAAYWRTNLTLWQLAPLFGRSRLPTASSATSAPRSRSSSANGSARAPF